MSILFSTAAAVLDGLLPTKVGHGDPLAGDVAFGHNVVVATLLLP